MTMMMQQSTFEKRGENAHNVVGTIASEFEGVIVDMVLTSPLLSGVPEASRRLRRQTRRRRYL